MTNGTYQSSRKRTCGPNTWQVTRRVAANTGPKFRRGTRGRRYSRLSLRRRKRRTSVSIKKLARKVAWNSQKLHGGLQTNLQVMSWADTGNDIRQQYPLLLDLTNFTSDNTSGTMPDSQCAGVYKMFQPSPNVFQVAQLGHWARSDFTGLQTGQTKYCPFNKGNADTCDTGKYFAVSSKYRLKFRVRGTVRMRIQIFTVRTSAITSYSDFMQLQLPTMLDGLNSMCNGNFLHRKFFKTYKDISRVIDPANNQTSGDFVLEMAFHHNKLIQQELTNPAVAPTNPQGTLAPNTPNQADATGIFNVTNGNWFLPINLTQGTPFWMLVSSDNPGAPSNIPETNKLEIAEFSRVVKWRDHVG